MQIFHAVRAVAATLVLSMIWVTGAQERALAMLAPVPTQTTDSVHHIDREKDLQTIQKTLESKVLRQRLHQLGLTDEEIQQRLSRMSDQQIHQMASQIRTVNPAGGMVIGLLVAILLVVLIIYLLKKI